MAKLLTQHVGATQVAHGNSTFGGGLCRLSALASVAKIVAAVRDAAWTSLIAKLSDSDLATAYSYFITKIC
jgi:hypothetical protein